MTTTTAPLPPELAAALTAGRALLIADEEAQAEALRTAKQDYLDNVALLVTYAKEFLPEYLRPFCAPVDESITFPLDKDGRVKEAEFTGCIDFQVTLPFGHFRFCVNADFSARGPISIYKARLEPNGTTITTWYEELEGGGWDKGIELILALVERQCAENAQLKPADKAAITPTKPTTAKPVPANGAGAKGNPNAFVRDQGAWERLVAYAADKGYEPNTQAGQEALCGTLMARYVPSIHAHNFTACKRILDAHYEALKPKEEKF